ncbi:uncharacterized protein KY384_008866 [Bacidia gigantensis]|uniref:uncharacterized protein n=1 Tax=Bacidia gigantensis TaxID=2732470 RepID=UPI001D0506A2|nr:uncharacterized protein KY384_008866 [Bacidia gigantensis]KAG8525222.1 hypothetical protein KY384_008866 [Bacidia gigantensis]
MPEAEDVLSGMTLATKMLFLTAYTNLGPSVYATTAEELHFVDYLILQKLQDPDFLTGFKFCVKRGNPWCPWVENPYCFPKKPEEDVVMTDAPKCKTPVKVYFDGVPQKQVPPPQQAPVQKDPSQEAVEQHQKQTGNQSNGQQNNQVSEQQKTSEHVKYAQQALSMANRMPPSEERQWMMNIATYILNEGQNDKKKEPEITYVPPYLTSIDSDGKPKFERLLTPEETRNAKGMTADQAIIHRIKEVAGLVVRCRLRVGMGIGSLMGPIKGTIMAPTMGKGTVVAGVVVVVAAGEEATV